jgi:hypothetical protein
LILERCPKAIETEKKRLVVVMLAARPHPLSLDPPMRVAG